MRVGWGLIKRAGVVKGRLFHFVFVCFHLPAGGFFLPPPLPLSLPPSLPLSPDFLVLHAFPSSPSSSTSSDVALSSSSHLLRLAEWRKGNEGWGWGGGGGKALREVFLWSLFLSCFSFFISFSQAHRMVKVPICLRLQKNLPLKNCYVTYKLLFSASSFPTSAHSPWSGVPFGAFGKSTREKVQ